MLGVGLTIANVELARLLEQLGAEVSDTAREVRSLAHGIYPPLLRANGLADALFAAASHATLPTRVQAGSLGRYPADIEAAVRASGLNPMEWMASYPRMLAQLTDPLRFPALARFIEAGVFETEDGPDDEFLFGLNRILDGIAVLIDRT